MPDRRDELREAILALLDRRGPGKTICPSEAARAVAGGAFRQLMDQAREVAAQLQDAGELVATQKGRPVDPLTARGPIRLGRPPDGGGATA